MMWRARGSSPPWAASARGLRQAGPRWWLRARAGGKPGWAEPALAWPAKSKAVSFFPVKLSMLINLVFKLNFDNL